VKKTIVGITIVGKDREGIVATFTNFVFQNGANIEKVNQNVMKGLFGMYLEVSFTKSIGYKGGIMITASHNPPEYNGIKPVASDGVEISREDELLIEDIYFNKKWQNSTQKFGTTTIEDKALETYLNGVKSQVDVDRIISKKIQNCLGFRERSAGRRCTKILSRIGL